MKKKIFAVMLAALMIVSLAACGGGAKKDTKYVVGICQLAQHDALDAASQGFMDAINAELPGEVSFIEKNASGEVANCNPIINGLIADDVDLILANATAPLQSASGATSEIPILGTSITDYASALELENYSGVVGGNISGTTDLAPLDQQAALIKEWLPQAHNIGIVYCSGEPNSQYQVDVITGYMEDLGFTVKPFAFTDTNDVASVTQAACDWSDAIYIPTDNTAASNTEAIANVVLPAGIPVFCGEANTCRGCGVATLSIDYYDLGYATGLMAVQILTGEADISQMPIQSAAKFTKMYNADNCALLNLEVPEGYVTID